MDTGSNAMDLDTLYDILSESQRRYVLYYFFDCDHATVDSLARQIAAWERDIAPESVSTEQKKQTQLSLLHNHLPRLEEQRLVAFDHRSGDVVSGNNFEAIRSTIERARERDGIGPVARTTTETFLYSDLLTESTSTDR
ncbi:DUF7344 domain-containing protein [Natrinema halophilum]|uniref:DUF7344 domain-containing protein n=1 Tax=Natrinema halophilum TaxID=1699371 RepID=A0A7D5KBE9_9EURY|nr:hypothetical protein [Natrinema halophilum]QLG47756.1 hypothetical protein HYG82_02295 [Natrinema halophilum]